MNGIRSVWLVWALLAGLLAPDLAQAVEPPALARQTGIDEAVVRVALDAGTNPQPLAGAVVRGKARWAPGITVQVAGGRAAAQAEWLRRQLDPGYVVFISQRRYGIGRQPDDVSVIRAKDRFEPLRVMGTGGPAYDLSPPRVLAKLRDWDRRYGVQLIGAGHDWVEVRLQRLPERLRRFAVEVVEFCPDVVGDVESVDRLGEELQLTRTLHLAWGRQAWEQRPPIRLPGTTVAGR
jgi:hypothetical protein